MHHQSTIVAVLRMLGQHVFCSVTRMLKRDKLPKWVHDISEYSVVCNARHVFQDDPPR
jgi:hypothetical protein